MTLEAKLTFNEKTYRQYLNGDEVVMHCHHYMSLLTRLAISLEEFGGPEILSQSAEDSIRAVLDRYHQDHQIGSSVDRIGIAREFYEQMGLGQMQVSGDATGGEVTLVRSHVDQGWVVKFGHHPASINFFTQGFLAAMFAAAYDRPPRGYSVQETSSLVKGDPVSRFSVQAR